MEQGQIFIQVAADCKIKEKTKCKVVVIGDYGVGKTNLIKKFVEGKFSKDSIKNIGSDFLTQTYLINNEVIRVEFWDTGAEEKFKILVRVITKEPKPHLLFMMLLTSLHLTM